MLKAKSEISLSENIDAFLFSLYLECRRGAEQKIWPYKNDNKISRIIKRYLKQNYPPNINFDVYGWH